ncbi:hypothetical protein [Oscillatoria sp. FACHB-1407]|uniref:hypothetical protein n=1 Tax=Oscillatoria sp. FACHB-1407 TaxID=2692847 RepID=UPI0018EF9AB2|nr:hypothetical protein [Oscillatoria sp. FACHB-1407]
MQNAKAVEIKLSTRDRQTIEAIGRMVTDHLGDDSILWYAVPLRQRIVSKLTSLQKRVVGKAQRQ